MAYTEFHGPHSTSAGDDVWHTRPTMFGSGNLTANRDGSTINLHLYAEKSTLSGSTTSFTLLLQKTPLPISYTLSEKTNFSLRLLQFSKT